jgi:hypothetical protein
MVKNVFNQKKNTVKIFEFGRKVFFTQLWQFFYVNKNEAPFAL